MSRYAQYETEMRSVADACGSLHEAYQEAEALARRINSDLRVFEHKTGQDTMENREKIKGLSAQMINRPQKGPFADEFFDKLDDALRSDGRCDGTKG